MKISILFDEGGIEGFILVSRSRSFNHDGNVAL